MVFMATELDEFDRHSPSSAKDIIERLVPDRVLRLALLEKVAESIRCAASKNPDGWGLTMFINGFRLNAGQVEVVLISERFLYFFVARPTGISLPVSCVATPSRYKTLPGCVRIRAANFPDLIAAWAMLGQSHLEAVRIGASRKGYRWKEAHSPGLLAYVERETGLTVPDPSWAPRSGTLQPKLTVPSDSVELIEAVEGSQQLALHYARERDKAIVAEAKRKWAEADPFLRCRVCGFSFVESFGVGYVEAHHVVALGTLAEDETTVTTIANLAPVCANCHKMLHNPAFKNDSIEDLSRIVKGETECRL
jgi:hypothetical protein